MFVPQNMNTPEPDWGLLGRYSHENRWITVPTKLDKVNCQVEIRGFVANIVSCLTYTNSSFNTLQVNFKSPVDEEAAIYKFEATVDDRIITTHCLEKKQATKIYEDAVRAGNTAILGREDVRSADIFMVNLGNLPPGKTAELRLSMVMELKVCAGGGLSFIMPTMLNPRYDPGTSHQNQNSPIVSIPTASVSVPAQYILNVSAKIVGSHAIAKVESPTDSNNVAVYIAPDKLSANVVQDKGFQCNHDWSLLIYYINPYKMHVLRETGDHSAAGHMKDDIVMINVFPELPSSSYSNKNEIIFVVDRSGSMQGVCIESARETLLLFLKSLPQGCLFNIVSFGNSHSILFPEGSREYNEVTLGAACGLQSNMQADMGGTEIFTPLRDIFSRPNKPGFARQVIVLTDGQVANVKQVTDLIGRNSNNTRLFSVGIGAGASSALVKGMARAGRGRYEMVQDHTNLHVKVMSLMKSMVQQSVQDVTVSCDVDPVSRVTLVPPAPPIIFGGSHLILYARILPKTEVSSVTIKGCVGDQECTVKTNCSEITRVHDENLSLHRMAARAQILAWETDDEENNKQSIIHLSEASGVVSRWTALVGVDQDGNQSYYRSKVVQDVNQQFAVASASSFGTASAGLFGSTSSATFGSSGFSKPSGFSFGMQPTNGLVGCNVAGGGLFTKSSQSFGEIQRLPQQQQNLFGAFQSTKSPIEGLIGLVHLQQFNGSWKLDSIANFINVSVDILRQKCPIQKLESDLHYESMRLKTFIKWPLDFINPVELAASGFYFTNSSDQCVCVFCKGGINNWEQGDTPSGEHKKHFPQCLFVLGQDVGNISASEEEKIPLSPNVESAWATCLALVRLETHFSVQRQQWELIAQKAQTYLLTNNTAFLIEAAKATINDLKLVK